jgi:hypothetical protein
MLNGHKSALIVLLASALLASPAFAAKNTGGFDAKVNVAAQKQLCADLKDMLDVAESEADKRAGTKAAASYAQQADRIWSDGEKNSCSWAR